MTEIGTDAAVQSSVCSQVNFIPDTITTKQGQFLDGKLFQFCNLTSLFRHKSMRLLSIKNCYTLFDKETTCNLM